MEVVVLQEGVRTPRSHHRPQHAPHQVRTSRVQAPMVDGWAKVRNHVPRCCVPSCVSCCLCSTLALHAEHRCVCTSCTAPACACPPTPCLSLGVNFMRGSTAMLHVRNALFYCFCGMVCGMLLCAARTTVAGHRMATATARCSTLPRSTPALRRLPVPPERRPPPPPPTGRDPMPQAWTPRPAPHCCRRWWRPGSGQARR